MATTNAINWSTGVVHKAISAERDGRPVWLPACKRGKATLVSMGADATVTCTAKACGGTAAPKTPKAPKVSEPKPAPVVAPVVVGMNQMTGVTHKARMATIRRAVRDDLLVQTCGMSDTQRTYLIRQPEGTEITCRRCNR